MTGANRGSRTCSNHARPVRAHPPLAEQHAGGQRNDDEDEHRVEQHLERHVERGGAAHEEPDDRREQHQHDQVVHRDLDERVGGIAVGEVAPDEDHRRARRRRQDDAAGDVLVGVSCRNPGGEDVPEEHPREERHRERLHEPVDEQRDEEAARAGVRRRGWRRNRPSSSSA